MSGWIRGLVFAELKTTAQIIGVRVATLYGEAHQTLQNWKKLFLPIPVKKGARLLSSRFKLK